MSKTIRKGKYTNLRDGLNDFWFKHDDKLARVELNKEFRKEEKEYFEKFGDVKYNQKPKSRGWRSH